LSGIINKIEPYTVFGNNLESDFRKDRMHANHMIECVATQFLIHVLINFKKNKNKKIRVYM
jgi:hypothetical protein